MNDDSTNSNKVVDIDAAEESIKDIHIDPSLWDKTLEDLYEIEQRLLHDIKKSQDPEYSPTTSDTHDLREHADALDLQKTLNQIHTVIAFKEEKVLEAGEILDKAV